MKKYRFPFSGISVSNKDQIVFYNFSLFIFHLTKDFNY